MRVTDKYIYFWGDWTSNFQSAKFTTKVDGKACTFHNSEQYFMYIKALTFHDEKIAEQILREGIDPKKAKRLGRKVSNFDNDLWDKLRYRVMLKANMLKYTQNEDLKKKLLDPKFDGKHFVEASIYDTIWAIGCCVDDAKDDQSNWNGMNLLGQVLDDVREKLLAESDASKES